MPEKTPEERMDELKGYYHKQIPYLKLQKEYFELIRDIAVAQAETENARMVLAQLKFKENATKEG